MADGEGAVCSGIGSRSAGDCKDIGVAGWWCMWKVAVESPTLDGDLTLSEYERPGTLQTLETRIVDRADRHRPPEQLTVPAKAHRPDVPVTQREAVRRHVHEMMIARRGLDGPER